MNSFPLKIVTPDGLMFDGRAEEVIVRTTDGDVGILSGHIDCVSPLGMGRATIVTDGQKRIGACIGGILSVVNGEVRLVPTTFEWAENIDPERAAHSLENARKVLADKDASRQELMLAEAKMKRALVRKGVYDQMQVK